MSPSRAPSESCQYEISISQAAAHYTQKNSLAPSQPYTMGGGSGGPRHVCWRKLACTAEVHAPALGMGMGNSKVAAAAERQTQNPSPFVFSFSFFRPGSERNPQWSPLPTYNSPPARGCADESHGRRYTVAFTQHACSSGPPTPPPRYRYGTGALSRHAHEDLSFSLAKGYIGAGGPPSGKVGTRRQVLGTPTAQWEIHKARAGTGGEGVWEKA